MNKTLFAAFLLLFTTSILLAKKETLAIYYDCSNLGIDCYYNYVRQENTLFTFVRDRMDADIHVLLISNTNSIGTTTVTYQMIGKKEFDGMQDTINFTIPLNSTDDDKRKIVCKKIYK